MNNKCVNPAREVFAAPSGRGNTEIIPHKQFLEKVDTFLNLTQSAFDESLDAWEAYLEGLKCSADPSLLNLLISYRDYKAEIYQKRKGEICNRLFKKKLAESID